MFHIPSYHGVYTDRGWWSFSGAGDPCLKRVMLMLKRGSSQDMRNTIFGWRNLQMMSFYFVISQYMSYSFEPYICDLIFNSKICSLVFLWTLDVHSFSVYRALSSWQGLRGIWGSKKQTYNLTKKERNFEQRSATILFRY